MRGPGLADGGGELRLVRLAVEAQDRGVDDGDVEIIETPLARRSP